MEKKQTAVEWLMEQITYDNGFGARLASYIESVDLLPEFEQALAMEREQIEEAFRHGDDPTLSGRLLSDKEYYTETYGK